MSECKNIGRTLHGRIGILPAVILFMFFSAYLFSQENGVKPTRQSALDAFSKGNMEKALVQFKELSSDYPKDPLYKYYCGVILVNLEKDPVSASMFLRQAQLESAAIKTIPGDASFFLGRALQMSGNYIDAIKSYNQFTDLVGKKAAKERSTPQFIEQCNERKGELILLNKVKPAVTIAGKNDSMTVRNAPVLNTEPNPNILMKKTLPEGYEDLLNKALTNQFMADSLGNAADSLKRKSGNYPEADKQKIRASISNLEQLAAAHQKLANESLAAAERMLNPKKAQNFSGNEKFKSDSLAEKGKKSALVLAVPAIRDDSSLVKKVKITTTTNTQKTDNQIIKDTIIRAAAGEGVKEGKQNTVEVYSVFDITQNPVFTVDEKTPVNPEVEPGLIYRIQVAVFKNPVASYYFKGLTPVYGFKTEGSDVTKYYAGMFRKSADASKALARIKTFGFKDAIVVAMFDKKVVSFERAALLEREWGKKPFLITDVKIPDKQQDTAPSTLIFRVEVVNSPKPLPQDQLDNIKRLAGNRGLEIMINATQQYVYLIGKFLTFESAADYADLLKRNGQKDAKVVAYLGRKEIPVETAKQLFEKIE